MIFMFHYKLLIVALVLLAIGCLPAEGLSLSLSDRLIVTRVQASVNGLTEASTALTSYKDISRGLNGLRQASLTGAEAAQAAQQNLQKFSKFLKFGKLLTALGGIGAVLSIVLAFIPVPNPVLGIVKKLDSKVDTLSSQLEDVKNVLIARLESSIYSAQYTEYEFNVKNTWDFYTSSVEPHISNSLDPLKEIDIARILTWYTEKYDANQVMDSLRNLHRILVGKGPSLSRNLLDLIIRSTNCRISSILELRALYDTLFLQGSLLTMRYMVFKRFPAVIVQEELEIIQKLYQEVIIRFQTAEKTCYQEWRSTAQGMIAEGLNAAAKDSVEAVSEKLSEKLNAHFHWIDWYPVVYDENKSWKLGEYLYSRGDFIQVSAGGRNVAAMFSPKYSPPLPSTTKECNWINNVATCSQNTYPQPTCTRNNTKQGYKYSFNCNADLVANTLGLPDGVIGIHVLKAYYASNAEAKDNWKYGRPSTNSLHPMITGDRLCRTGLSPVGYEKTHCEMKVTTSLDLRKNRTNPCLKKLCGDHGTCYIKWEYSSELGCFCAMGYAGPTCEDVLQVTLDLSDMVEIKVGAVDMALTFYSLRDELHEVQQNLSEKIVDLAFTIEEMQQNFTDELSEFRLELNNKIYDLSEDIKQQTDMLQTGINKIRHQFDAESQLLFSQLFYADERKIMHLVSDYFTELMMNKMSKTDFVTKMEILNKPSTPLNFDIVRRRYNDWQNGRNTIGATNGIVNTFKKKFWTSSDESLMAYVEKVNMVKNYTINEFSWFVEAWRELEMLHFQKQVQDFDQWDMVNSIFDQHGLLNVRNKFGDLIITPLSEEIPTFTSLVKFQESSELKSALELNFGLKWQFLQNSCGLLRIDTGIGEKFLEAGDSFEGQRVTSQCDPKSGFIIYKSQYSVCDRTSHGRLEWSTDTLKCSQIGLCCLDLTVTSSHGKLANFLGRYKRTQIIHNSHSVYQKLDSLRRPQNFFIFYGATGWYMDTRISSGTALAWVPEQRGAECPAHSTLRGGWQVSLGTHWAAEPKLQINCV